MCSKYFLILGCAVCCISTCHGQDNGALQQRFLREAPEAWEKFSERARRLQGAFSLEVLLDGKPVGKERKEFRQTQGCALILHQSLFPDTGEIDGWQTVANTQYGFALRRGDDTKPWAVSRVTMIGDKKHSQASAFANVERWVNAPITLFMLSEMSPEEKKGDLRIVVKEPGFSLEKITAQDKGGKDWVKIVFIYRPAGKSTRTPSVVTGWAILDPERDWSIQEDECNFEWARSDQKATFNSKFQYEGPAGRFPALKRIEMTHVNPNKAFTRRSALEFDLRVAEPHAEDFTLAAFGFPEPVGVSWPKSTRWWIGISLAAAGTLGGAGLLVMLRRCYTKSPAAAEAHSQTKVGIS